MARHVDTLILDHHLLRCEEGLSWMDPLSSGSGYRNRDYRKECGERLSQEREYADLRVSV